jgi:DNA-binding NarL/FixJ family response regulator
MRIVLEAGDGANIEVLGVAHDGQEAIDLARQTKPDIILMDVRMPIMNGVEATRVLHDEMPDVKILILTTFQDDALVQNALASGAVGYILKEVQPDELIESIRAVHNGFHLYSPSIGTLIAKQVGDASAERDPDHQAIHRVARAFPELARREAEILHYISLSYDNNEIAQSLFLAEQTVKNYVTSIYAKLGVRDRLHCVRMINARLRE